MAEIKDGAIAQPVAGATSKTLIQRWFLKLLELKDIISSFVGSVSSLLPGTKVETGRPTKATPAAGAISVGPEMDPINPAAYRTISINGRSISVAFNINGGISIEIPTGVSAQERDNIIQVAVAGYYPKIPTVRIPNAIYKDQELLDGALEVTRQAYIDCVTVDHQKKSSAPLTEGQKKDIENEANKVVVQNREVPGAQKSWYAYEAELKAELEEEAELEAE